MKTFDTVALYLTPLTPIHIGCGMDFEPTNYVIDDGILFHFDPARAVLSDKDRAALMSALGKGGTESLLRVQKFFHDRRQTYAGASHHCVAVAGGVAEQYRQRIGQIAQFEANGGRVTNQLEIERTAHHPHTGTPYIPGSSLKGAMRTAWLDQLNNGRSKPAEEKGAQDVEKRLLGGSFHSDPFRLVRLADSTGEGVAGMVYFSTNHKKQVVHDKNGQLVVAKGPSARRESIVAGQYRAMRGEIRFDMLPGMGMSEKTPKPDRRISGFTDLARACNRYYRPRLERECELLDSRRFVNPDWLTSLKALLQSIKPQLENGELMLLRVGRHSGAESVTLDGIREIKIMTGKGNRPQYSNVGAKTLWLAAERENDRSDLLPFGWLLIEHSDTQDHPAFKKWCESQPKPDLAAVHARLAEARRAAQAEGNRLQKLAEERAAAEAEAFRVAAEKAARLATMTANQRSVEAFIQQARQRKEQLGNGKEKPNTGIHGVAQQLCKSAREGAGWTDEEKLALAEAVEYWLKVLVERYDQKQEWKEARKKLGLAGLKGEV